MRSDHPRLRTDQLEDFTNLFPGPKLLKIYCLRKSQKVDRATSQKYQGFPALRVSAVYRSAKIEMVKSSI